MKRAAGVAAMMIVFTVVALSLFLQGCGGGAGTTIAGAGNTAPRLVSSSPSDGAAGVATGTVVSAQFSMPMNMQSVENNFHMYAGPDESSPTMGGEFTWNDTNTMMTFTPSEPMVGNATYTIHFGTGMMGMSGGMMMDMSGNQMAGGGVSMHFKTD